jgi:hypothetical protein
MPQATVDVLQDERFSERPNAPFSRIVARSRRASTNFRRVGSRVVITENRETGMTAFECSARAYAR